MGLRLARSLTTIALGALASCQFGSERCFTGKFFENDALAYNSAKTPMQVAGANVAGHAFQTHGINGANANPGPIYIEIGAYSDWIDRNNDGRMTHDEMNGFGQVLSSTGPVITYIGLSRNVQGIGYWLFRDGETVDFVDRDTDWITRVYQPGRLSAGNYSIIASHKKEDGETSRIVGRLNFAVR